MSHTNLIRMRLEVLVYGEPNIVSGWMKPPSLAIKKAIANMITAIEQSKILTARGFLSMDQRMTPHNQVQKRIPS